MPAIASMRPPHAQKALRPHYFSGQTSVQQQGEYLPAPRGAPHHRILSCNNSVATPSLSKAAAAAVSQAHRRLRISRGHDPLTISSHHACAGSKWEVAVCPLRLCPAAPQTPWHDITGKCLQAVKISHFMLITRDTSCTPEQCYN